jgi:hypothetical protein
MSKMILCSVYDQKAKRFGPVQTHTHMVDAERLLKDIIDQGNNNIAKFPKDFSLFKVADYDTSSGKIDHLSTHVLVCHASDLVHDVQDEKRQG